GVTRGRSTSYCPLAVLVFDGVSQIGCTNAPSPAESHTANRTHAFPVGSNGIANFFVPFAPRSVAGMTWRSIFLPSPHTTSTNERANGHSRSALIVRFAPVPATL